MALHKTLCRCGEVLYAPLPDGEGVIMSVAERRLFSLNAVGRRLWELLAAPKTLPELCAAIAGEFEVDAATCEAEVTRFMSDIVNRGIARAS